MAPVLDYPTLTTLFTTPILTVGTPIMMFAILFSATISYELPGTHSGNSLIRYVTNGWAADSLLRSNSAQPVNITTGQYSFGLVWNNDAINQRPNVVSSEPLYIYGSECRVANGGSACPGGKRLNPAHLSTPSDTFTQVFVQQNRTPKRRSLLTTTLYLSQAVSVVYHCLHERLDSTR